MQKNYFLYLLKKCFAQIRLYKLIFTHSLPTLTINNYFCFKNMNIMFCNRIRGCRLTKYPGPFVCILLIMEAQHVLRNGIGIEENICNTVQLTRTMAVENYACFIKNIKDLCYKILLFSLFCQRRRRKTFLYFAYVKIKGQKTQGRNKEMLIRTTK